MWRTLLPYRGQFHNARADPNKNNLGIWICGRNLPPGFCCAGKGRGGEEYLVKSQTDCRSWPRCLVKIRNLFTIFFVIPYLLHIVGKFPFWETRLYARTRGVDICPIMASFTSDRCCRHLHLYHYHVKYFASGASIEEKGKSLRVACTCGLLPICTYW